MSTGRTAACTSFRAIHSSPNEKIKFPSCKYSSQSIKILFQFFLIKKSCGNSTGQIYIWCARRESNPRFQLRRLTSYPLDYERKALCIITENKLFVEQFFIVLLLSAALSCLLM